tara:strand:+ start:4146 stop:4844 length:699 start_codon:yes stop_codon:yes gene_type:complete
MYALEELIMAFVVAESLAEQIANHLADRIIQGDLVNNERIQEARIVSELQVSRGSVREALLILERRHLVTIQPRRGAYVTELNADRVRSLYRLYGNLLEMLAEKLAWSWKEEDKKKLELLVNKLRNTAAVHDHHLFIEANFELISSAAVAAGNEYLKTALDNLQPPLHRALALALRKNLGEMDETSLFVTRLIECTLSDQNDEIPALVNEYCKRHCSLVVQAIEANTLKESV